MSLMRRILNAGIYTEVPPYLQDKIKISNQVALMMAGVGLIYTIFSIIFYPSLTVYPVFCMIFSFTAILLNYLGMYNVSRFLLSTLVLLLAYLYHGFLVQPGEDLITSMYVIEFALAVIPWVLIDFKEKTLLIFSVLTCYLLFFSQPWANDLLHEDLDSALFRSGWLSLASFGFGVMIVMLCLLFMQYKNYNSELKNEELLRDIKIKNAEMENQQTELQKNLNEVQLSRQQEEKQSWVAGGIARVGEILQQGDGDNVYIELISTVVKYVGANQGGMYLVKGEESGEKYLELVSCYAYEKQKFIDKRIEIGQGLVGQCYLESEPMILKEIPEDYISITSGLGDAPPTFLVIIPMKQEELVTGVLEIACFRELEQHQLEFLNRIAENIASFIVTNTLNVKTKMLLEQTQMQMEQLRAQEEEMRQNMEELQAIQEEMHRKEKEYIQRIQALENPKITDNDGE